MDERLLNLSVNILPGGKSALQESVRATILIARVDSLHERTFDIVVVSM